MFDAGESIAGMMLMCFDKDRHLAFVFLPEIPC